MNESTEILIRELSEKLGTTAEHLWGVMVKQAYVYASTTALIITALVIATGFFYKKLPKFDDDNGITVFLWTSWGFLAFVTFVAVIAEAQMIVTGFLNPEFWALKQLLP